MDAPTTEAAVQEAKEIGESVEDLSQRTESSSVFANEDGSFTLHDFGGTVRVDKAGEWVPVDYRLVQQPDGSYEPAASDIDISVNGGGVKEAARVAFEDGTSLAFTWNDALPTPTIDGGVATYKLSDATDLVVAVTGTGVTARIRLNEPPAKGDHTFELGLRAKGVEVDQLTSGGLKIADAEGNTVGDTTQLLAWDARTDNAGDPVRVVDLEANLETGTRQGDVVQHTLELTTPEGFLSDPATVWPVTIDPDISMEKTRDTYVRNGDTAKGSAANLIVGKIRPAVSSNANPTRSYLKFYNGTIEDNPDIDIVSAELGLWQYYGYSCAARQMNIHPVDVAWNDNITWANKPPVVTMGANTMISANRGNVAAGCGHGWSTANVTAMAEAWADGDIDMQGVRLAAADEENSAFERRFCSMNPISSESVCNAAAKRPYLNVTYLLATGNGQAENLGQYGLAAKTIAAPGDSVAFTPTLNAGDTLASVATSSVRVADGGDQPLGTYTFAARNSANQMVPATATVSGNTISVLGSSEDPADYPLTVTPGFSVTPEVAEEQEGCLDTCSAGFIFYKRKLINKSKVKNFTNWKKEIGQCVTGTDGMVCNINSGASSTRTIGTALGFSRGGVAGQLNISSANTVTVSATCSAVINRGQRLVGYAIGSRHTYKVQRKTYYNLQHTDTTVSGWRKTFNPYKAGLYCRVERV